MYNAYFVNLNTGELYTGADPKNDLSPFYYPEFNVLGISKISEDFYNLLQKSYELGLEAGLSDI